MSRADERARRLIAMSLVVTTAAIPARASAATTCPDGRAPIFLTFDTGSESQAELIRDVLHRHHVQATFFLANEKTTRGDWSLDPSWAPYWKSLVADGHAFGTHTFDHVYYRGDDGRDRVRVRPQFGAQAGRTMSWTAADYCGELDRVAKRFESLTGATLDPFWRAPGGHTSPRLLAFGRSCGYRHFGWSPAGFVGDELPSDRYPNAMLLDRALAHLEVRRHRADAPRHLVAARSRSRRSSTR